MQGCSTKGDVVRSTKRFERSQGRENFGRSGPIVVAHGTGALGSAREQPGVVGTRSDHTDPRLCAAVEQGQGTGVVEKGVATGKQEGIYRRFIEHAMTDSRFIHPQPKRFDCPVPLQFDECAQTAIDEFTPQSRIVLAMGIGTDVVEKKNIDMGQAKAVKAGFPTASPRRSCNRRQPGMA